MTRPLILPLLRRTAKDAEAADRARCAIHHAKIEAATRAYCEAWCSEFAMFNVRVPPDMIAQSGPTFEALWSRLTRKYAASLPVLRAAAEGRTSN